MEILRKERYGHISGCYPGIRLGGLENIMKSLNQITHSGQDSNRGLQEHKLRVSAGVMTFRIWNGGDAPLTHITLDPIILK
jgi:hypothetical protein